MNDAREILRLLTKEIERNAENGHPHDKKLAEEWKKLIDVYPLTLTSLLKKVMEKNEVGKKKE